MKLKNEIVFNSGFAKSFGSLLKLAFPATVTLQLLETLKALDEQQKNVFAVRDSLIDRLGARAESGVKFNSPEAEKEFYSEMEKLLKLEFEIPLKEKLKLDDRIQISGEDVLTLQPVLDVNI